MTDAFDITGHRKRMSRLRRKFSAMTDEQLSDAVTEHCAHHRGREAEDRYPVLEEYKMRHSWRWAVSAAHRRRFGQ